MDRAPSLISNVGADPKQWRDELRAHRDRFLHTRLRTALWICLFTTPLYEVAEYLTRGARASTLYQDIPLNAQWVLIAQLAFIGLVLIMQSRPIVRNHVLPITCLFTAELSLTTALAGIGRGDATVTPVMLLLLTFMASVLLPWGALPQFVLAVICSFCLGLNLVWLLGPSGLFEPLAWAVTIGFGLSVIIAYWLERTRTALVVEVLNRRLAQRELREVNDALELRVDERTHSLTQANRLLEEEINERKKAELEAHTSRLAAEAANEAKTQFLATMSHELRTPLNVVVGASDMLLDSEMDEDQLRNATTIRHFGENLSRLIDDLLDLAKIESKKLNLQPVDFPVRDLIERLSHAFHQQAASRGLQLATTVDSEVPEWLHGDPQRIEQILNNFLSNALKFTPHGEIVLEGQLLSQDASWCRLRFSVTDSGPGIAREDQARIFHPFVQIDGSTTAAQGGVGLGLSICRQLAAIMNGQVGVESDPGRGACFWFEVPLAREQLAREDPKPSVPSDA